ncbi:ATP-dependent DNA ligase [Thermoflavimicrobium dichotomicum]|uniref:DNA ligase-1 n=1 Tax=Thermoflavimicrobium dichotomicum TaxID=46223 RepID=A0A1I3UKZ7_9BACL|nr:RNA ligase family protein [Thermoflavimicrobium dichotomicum]SFJ82461.1 DNA ligase-1 [Thermoflavimicrobium dichotomicum]
MFITPMLLQKSDKAFHNAEYISEMKYDGIRLILSTVDGIHAYTRHETLCTKQFPELQSVHLPSDSILDGELIVTNKHGHPDFESIIKRFQTTNERKIQSFQVTLPVQYCVFDILRYEGKDLTKLPLIERKAILDEVIEDNEVITRVPYIEGNGKQLFNLVQQQGLEGIVLKKKDSIYEVGKRSWNWQKVINYQHYDVVITGYRKGEFGLLIGFEDGRPAGLIEFPPPRNVRKALFPIMNQAKVKEDERFVYVRPKIRCRVKSRGLTSNGLIRIPVFKEFLFAS